MSELPASADGEAGTGGGADPDAARPGERTDGVALAHEVIDLLLERQASDVVLLDLTDLSAFAEYFVIASAGNERQLHALVDTVQRSMKERYGRLAQDGEPSEGWVLIQLPAGVVAHLFSEEARAHYDLEGLWARAQEVVRIQ